VQYPLLVHVAGSAAVRALLDGGGMSGAGETEKVFNKMSVFGQNLLNDN